ncbi:hypothetical protein BB561_000830 [Smittium simulii]|uniref:Peptidase S1 domain-containing protein n=1 Tax=Smittium simulii TaxID=133385 RepID=A0A2T9YXD5_9FUNG|nr:hypothetical protein BB561_000830 [Smittium simulii]
MYFYNHNACFINLFLLLLSLSVTGLKVVESAKSSSNLNLGLLPREIEAQNHYPISLSENLKTGIFSRQDDSSENKSDSSEDKGDSSEDKGDTSEDKSDSSEDKSDSSEDKSDSSENKGNSSENRSISSEDKSDTSENKSDTSEDKSDSSENKGNSSEEKNDISQNKNDTSVSDEMKYTSTVLKSGPFFGSLALSTDGTNKRVCTVTIVAPKTFLTSFQCIKSLNVEKELSRINIFIGDNKKFESVPKGEGIKISRIYTDEKSGLSILKTDTDIEYNSTISQIPISIRDLGKGDVVFLLKSQPNEQKPFNKIVVGDLAKCKDAFSKFQSHNKFEICTDPYEGQEKCNDELGGDPIIGFSNLGLALVAISGSYRAPSGSESSCKNKDALRFSTKISNYLGFISIASGVDVKNLTSTAVLKFTKTDINKNPANLAILSNLTDSIDAISNATSGSKNGTDSESSKKSAAICTHPSLYNNSYFGFVLSVLLLFAFM